MTTTTTTEAVALVLTVCLGLTSGFPTGAPLSACSHLMPLHMDGELMTVVSPYLLVVNDTTYGNSPIKLTVTTMGQKNYMAFMLQARSEFGEPAGHFSEAPVAARAMTCYGDDDTLTHTAAFIRTGMEVVWHPPPKNIGRITIEGSISLNKIKYWPVRSEYIQGTGPVDKSGAPKSPPKRPSAGRKGENDSTMCTVAMSSVALSVLIGFSLGNTF